jgi:hypothetical protein
VQALSKRVGAVPDNDVSPEGAKTQLAETKEDEQADLRLLADIGHHRDLLRQIPKGTTFGVNRGGQLRMGERVESICAPITLVKVKFPPAFICLILGHRLDGPPEVILGIEIRRCARCGKVV